MVPERCERCLHLHSKGSWTITCGEVKKCKIVELEGNLENKKVNMQGGVGLEKVMDSFAQLPKNKTHKK